jgi:probable phosphoglycerate mutase
MPKKIIIVRHGQTAHNKNRIMQGHLDTDLDETGRLQAIDAAKLLANETIDVTYSSDLKRAMQTAQAAISGMPIRKTPLLRERYFGKFQGMTIDQIGQYLSKFGEQGNFSFQGREKEFDIETEEEIVKRIEEFKKILDTHRGKTVAVFSHGGFIKRFLKELGVKKDNIDTMYIPNASPMVLIKKGDTYILEE